jgi:hypothetical protein
MGKSCLRELCERLVASLRAVPGSLNPGSAA